MSRYLFTLSKDVLRGFAGKSFGKPSPPLTTRLYHSGRTMVKFVTQTEAVSIDQELFHSYKFSLEQLMELAGLACACAIYKCYCPEKYQSAIVLCGPGNNGGDGLVCARHMKLFGFNPEIYYPKQNQAPHFKNLMEQCDAMDIPFHDKLPEIDNYSMAVDALFGFSFKPPVRSEFQAVVDKLCTTKAVICSIDIPSGWDVNTGSPENSFLPELLISLTAPKKGATHFCGKYHFLAGRFVPPKLAALYNLQLPKFQNTDCCIDITGWEDLPEGGHA